MAPKLDEFHYHEMLDRLSVVISIVDSVLVQHPVAKLDKNIQQLIDEANEKLSEAYQLAGGIRANVAEWRPVEN